MACGRGRGGETGGGVHGEGEGGGWMVDGYQSPQAQSMAYSRVIQARAVMMERTKTLMWWGSG